MPPSVPAPSPGKAAVATVGDAATTITSNSGRVMAGSGGVSDGVLAGRAGGQDTPTDSDTDIPSGSTSEIIGTAGGIGSGDGGGAGPGAEQGREIGRGGGQGKGEEEGWAAVLCKCRNVRLRVRPAQGETSGASGEGRKVGKGKGKAAGKGQDDKGSGEGGKVEMVLQGAESIRHVQCATFEPVLTDTDRPSRRQSNGATPTSASNGAPSAHVAAGGPVDPDAEVVRKCWICEVEVYTAKGKGKEEVLGDGERVLVDTDSEVYHAKYPFSLSQDTSSAPRSTFSDLTLDLPSTSSSFGRPPSSSVSSSSLYPTLSPNTLASNRTQSSTQSSSHKGAAVSAGIGIQHSHPLLPRLADPFFLPPPFTPSHPLLSEWCASAVSFLHEAQDKAERDVRTYIESKAREMAAVQEQTRKEVELLWRAYASGQGKGQEVERRRSRSVSVSRRASRGAASGTAGRKPSGLQTSVFTGAGSARAGEEGVGGSALDVGTDEETSPGPSPQPQPTDNPILRESISQSAYTGGSLLSASISRNSYMQPVSSFSPSANQSTTASGSNLNPSNSRAVATADNAIDDLTNTNTLPLQDDQRAVAMSYVFSGMDEMVKQRQTRERRASSSRDREARELANVNEAVDQVQKDVHGKDSWIDEERNLAARYTASRATSTSTKAGADAQKTAKGMEEDERKIRGDEDHPVAPGGEGDEDIAREGEKEGQTPRAGNAVAQGRPRVTFQETKPVREPKVSGGDDGAEEEEDGKAGEVKEGEDAEEDNVFDFELEDTSPPVRPADGPASSAIAKAPQRPKVQDMYESLLSTTLASDIPSHRAAHQRMKATGQNPYEFLRRRVSGQGGHGDDDSLDGSEGSGSGIGTPRGNGSRSLLATSMPVNIVLPHRSGPGHRANAGLPPLEPKTSLSERQGLLVPGLRGAMRMSSSGAGNSNNGSVNGRSAGERGRTGPGRGAEDEGEGEGTPEATPRPRNHVQGFSTATLPATAHASAHTPSGAGRTRRASRSASVSREGETFRQDPGAVLELVGEADDVDLQSASPDDRDATGSRGSAGRGEEVGVGASGNSRERERRESDMRKPAFMPPHIIARQESARSGDVGWRSMVED